MPVNDIAHRLLLETNTVTPLLQRMEKAGLIKRTISREDMRQRIVSLTDKGKEMEEMAKDIPYCMGRDVIEQTGDPTELKQLVTILDQLNTGLTKSKQKH